MRKAVKWVGKCLFLCRGGADASSITLSHSSFWVAALDAFWREQPRFLCTCTRFSSCLFLTVIEESPVTDPSSTSGVTPRQVRCWNWSGGGDQGVSFSGDIPAPPGRGAVQRALGDPAWAGGWAGWPTEGPSNPCHAGILWSGRSGSVAVRREGPNCCAWGGRGGTGTLRHEPEGVEKHPSAWRNRRGGGWLSGGRILGRKPKQSRVYELWRCRTASVRWWEACSGCTTETRQKSWLRSVRADGSVLQLFLKQICDWTLWKKVLISIMTFLICPINRWI